VFIVLFIGCCKNGLLLLNFTPIPRINSVPITLPSIKGIAENFAFGNGAEKPAPNPDRKNGDTCRFLDYYYD